jgi:hypothetical protein
LQVDHGDVVISRGSVPATIARSASDRHGSATCAPHARSVQGDVVTRHARVIVVGGTLDAEGGQLLLDSLAAACAESAPGDRIELDLVLVRRTTTSGLGALAECVRVAGATGTEVAFRMGGVAPADTR